MKNSDSENEFEIINSEDGTDTDKNITVEGDAAVNETSSVSGSRFNFNAKNLKLYFTWRQPWVQFVLVPIIVVLFVVPYIVVTFIINESSTLSLAEIIVSIALVVILIIEYLVSIMQYKKSEEIRTAVKAALDFTAEKYGEDRKKQLKKQLQNAAREGDVELFNQTLEGAMSEAQPVAVSQPIEANRTAAGEESSVQGAAYSATKAETKGGKVKLLKKIKSKCGYARAEESKKSAVIALSVWFGLVLAGAIVLLVLGKFDFTSIYTLIAFMLIALLPAYILYLGAHNPANLKNKGQTILIAISIVLFIALDVLLFILFFYQNEAFSAIGMYAIVFMVLIEGVYIWSFLSFCKDLKNGWYVFFGIATPVIVALVIAAIAVYLLIQFVLIMLQMFSIALSKKPETKTYTIYVNGYERTLVKDGYDPVTMRDRYKDDTGNWWYSSDNGSTFTKE